MTGLDCRMQTKALNIFWHKAELRLVEQQEPEAPIFAISRPTLFGGVEEFLLQYPARLEPLTDRDIDRHRFTVRHGKKRRSFQAPDAATFDTWLSALEQVLEPKRESDQFSTPRTTTSNATTATSSEGKTGNATNSLGRTSTAGSTGTRSSSRGWTNSALASDPSSQCRYGSQPRAPALRLTLERPCFTRDPYNLKLIRLHRPASTIAGTANAKSEDDDVLEVTDADPEVEEEPEDIVTKPTELIGNEDILEENVVEIDESTDTADEVAKLKLANENISAYQDIADMDMLVVEAVPLATIVAVSNVNSEGGDISEDTSIADEQFVGESFALGDDSTTDKEIDYEVKTMIKDLINVVVAEQSVINAGDIVITDRMVNIESEVTTSNSMGKELKSLAAILSPTLKTKHKWMPLDPTNSRLIWVRCSVTTDVKSVPRSNSRRKIIKPARRWVPMDPSSTRLHWIMRVEHTAARIESRYKATSSTRKWVPLDPDNSRFIWVRHSVAATGGVASHGKQI